MCGSEKELGRTHVGRADGLMSWRDTRVNEWEGQKEFIMV